MVPPVPLWFVTGRPLFLVLEELLREAHEVEESHRGTSAPFLGLLLFLLLEGVVG